MDGYLTVEQVAERLGVKSATVRQYHWRGDMPPADGRVGNSPIWKTETIERWRRPGRGRRPGTGSS